MSRAPGIKALEEYFIRPPYYQVLYVLQNAERLGEERKKLRPKDILAGLRKLERRGVLFDRLLKETRLSQEEVFQIKVQDIDLNKGKIRIEGSKGKQEKWTSVENVKTLDMLREQVGNRQSGPLFLDSSVHSSSGVADISSARLSQVLAQLKYEGLIEKVVGRYYMSKKYISYFRGFFISETIAYDNMGEIHWDEKGWCLYGAALDDSRPAQEIRGKLGWIASLPELKSIMEEIELLNRNMWLESIAEHLSRLLVKEKLSYEEKGYALHHIRSEIKDSLKIKFFNEVPEDMKKTKESVARELNSANDRTMSILENDWEIILNRKFKNMKGLSEIISIAEKYDKGKNPKFDDKFLLWLYFEAYPQEMFFFSSNPLIVFGNFTKIAW